MSHVLLFQILEWLEFEITSEMEPKMHWVIEDLGENKACVEAEGWNQSEEVKLNDSSRHNNLRDMPQRNDDSELLVGKHMVNMVSEEEGLEFLFSNLVGDCVLVVELKSMLLVFDSCPDDASKDEVAEAEEGMIQNASFFILEIL
jgi:hypothetical protein